MSQSAGAGEAASMVNRHPVFFVTGMAGVYIAIALVAGLDAAWMVGMLAWLVVTVIGVRRFSGRPLGKYWPLIAGILVALVGSLTPLP
jgi:hypothetical protein